MTRAGAGLATDPSAAGAARAAAAQAAEGLDGAPADLAFLFLTAQHLGEAAEAAATVREELAPGSLLGCVAEGVVGREQEVEGGPAAAVWAASLPGASIRLFHAGAGDGEAVEIEGLGQPPEPDLVLLVVDPFTAPAGSLLGLLDHELPGVPVVGGIATGGGEAGAQALVLDDSVHDRGAVGAALSGVAVEAVVSQGCAPIGRESVITRAEGNVVYELAGKPALERLRETVAELSARERALAARGLLVGLVIDENKPEYGRRDFLMRGLLGADESTGAIAVGEAVRVGQTIRFHVRDAASADEDLGLALRETLATLEGRPAGALLFTCNGRGTHMFSRPHHDSAAVAGALGRPAVAGFFCGGEIGPVGGRSFLHGFTATLAVFGAG